jgi:hypothetical protein
VLPVVAAGAVAESGTRPGERFPIVGFWKEGAFTKRSVPFE